MHAIKERNVRVVESVGDRVPDARNRVHQRDVVLEQELVRAEAESLVAEAQLSNITREKLKSAFTYQFDALREH